MLKFPSGSFHPGCLAVLLLQQGFSCGSSVCPVTPGTQKGDPRTVTYQPVNLPGQRLKKEKKIICPRAVPTERLFRRRKVLLTF